MSPCRFKPLAGHAHDERVLIMCKYPRKELRMVHGVTAVVSLLRVAIKHPTEEGFGIVVCHSVVRRGKSAAGRQVLQEKVAEGVPH